MESTAFSLSGPGRSPAILVWSVTLTMPEDCVGLLLVTHSQLHCTLNIVETSFCTAIFKQRCIKFLWKR